MNRLHGDTCTSAARVPHTRGDEPDALADVVGASDVSPTPVGMNRLNYLVIGTLIGVPHTRGDEPANDRVFCGLNACSPHPWG